MLGCLRLQHKRVLTALLATVLTGSAVQANDQDASSVTEQKSSEPVAQIARGERVSELAQSTIG